MKKPCDHTRGGSRADGTPICIKCGEVLGATPDREPVGQAINCVMFVLDMVGAMAQEAEHYDEVAAEAASLHTIITQAQLILSYIKECRPVESVQ